MNHWEKFNEASLAEKEGFYSDIRYITDADYKHEKRVRKDLEIENLGEYHDFLLLGYVYYTCVILIIDMQKKITNT